MFVHVCASVHTTVKNQRPEKDFRGPVLPLSALFLWDRICHWNCCWDGSNNHQQSGAPQWRGCRSMCLLKGQNNLLISWEFCIYIQHILVTLTHSSSPTPIYMFISPTSLYSLPSSHQPPLFLLLFSNMQKSNLSYPYSFAYRLTDFGWPDRSQSLKNNN